VGHILQSSSDPLHETPQSRIKWHLFSGKPITRVNVT
jgi:hypothetical protein